VILPNTDFIQVFSIYLHCLSLGMAQKRPHPAAIGLHVPAYTLTCVACNYTAQSYNAYIGHLVSCPDPPQVRCSHCSTTFTDTEQLALHLGVPPLLSFLFNPPTPSSTTAVSTSAATVLTSTLSLPTTFSFVCIFPEHPSPTCHNVAGYYHPSTCISHPNTPLLGSIPCSPPHAQCYNHSVISVFLFPCSLRAQPHERAYKLWTYKPSLLPGSLTICYWYHILYGPLLIMSTLTPLATSAANWCPGDRLVRAIQHEFAELLLRSPYY